MSAVWQSKPLGEVAAFLNGLWKGEKPPYVTVGVIRNTNFAKDGSIDDSDIAFLDVEAKKFEKRKLKYGDIILEKSGGGPKQPVGRVALFEKQDGDYSFSNFTSAIRVNDPKELDFRYLHKFLFWKYASGVTAAMQSHSTGIRNLNADAYKEIAVPLPPLPEQQRIVAILDEAFAGLATATANAEKNLKNARELFEGYLNSIFKKRGTDWVDRAVSEVADHCLGKMLDRNKNRGEPKPYLRNLNVRWFDFDLSDVLEMRFEKDEVDRYSAIKGDLLICEGGYPGRAAIWERDEPIFFQKAIHRVRFHAPWLTKWFLYFLYIQDTTGKLRSHFTGAGIQHFTGQALAKFKFPIPSEIEVGGHVAKFDELATQTSLLEKTYEEKLRQIGKLKQSILQKAFSGELTSPPSQAIKEAAE